MGAKEMDMVDEVPIYWGISRPFNYGSSGMVDTLLTEEDPEVDDQLIM
jgi:hypothetical protein